MSSAVHPGVEAGAVEALRPEEVQPQGVRQQHDRDHRGDRRARAASAADAARASARRAGASAQTPRNTAQRQRDEEQPLGGDRERDRDQHAEDQPRRAAACPGVRSANTRHSSSGTSQPAVQLRCALACETMPGAKPMNSAADRRRRGERDEVPGQQPVPGVRGRGEVERQDHQERDRRADRVRSAGRTRTAYTVIEVLTARLAPSGTLIRWREERVLAVSTPRARRSEQPLEQRLVAGVDRDRPPVRVGPQPAGHPDRERRARRPRPQVGARAPAATRGSGRRVESGR